MTFTSTRQVEAHFKGNDNIRAGKNFSSQTSASSASLKALHSQAFTLVELLVVIAIISILAALLLPALVKTKLKGSQVVCLNNQKQLALAWQMYADDNGGSVVGFSTFPLNGIPGVTPPDPTDWRTDVQFVQPNIPQTNQQAVIQATEAGFRQPMNMGTKIINGPLYQYAPNSKVIHCPGDSRLSQPVGAGFAWDSYSGVEGVNGEAMYNGVTNSVMITKASQIMHPSERILWVEECDGRGDNLGSWDFNPGTPQDGFQTQAPSWIDSPAAFHGDTSTFNFVDGHAEAHRWLNGSTIYFATSLDPNKASDSVSQIANNPLYGTNDLYWVATHYPTINNP